MMNIIAAQLTVGMIVRKCESNPTMEGCKIMSVNRFQAVRHNEDGETVSFAPSERGVESIPMRKPVGRNQTYQRPQIGAPAAEVARERAAAEEGVFKDGLGNVACQIGGRTSKTVSLPPDTRLVVWAS